MKVYDLSCDNGHCFEGWFADEADYGQQQKTALLSCPLCNSHTIHKLLSAPRLNLRSSAAFSKQDISAQSASQENGHSHPASAQTSSQDAGRLAGNKLQAKDSHLGKPQEVSGQAQHWLSEMRAEIAKTVDVGESFPEQARLMHQGDIEAKPIRGIASKDEVVELIKEGVPILPVPAILNETLQ